jgi:hypothetical protein
MTGLEDLFDALEIPDACIIDRRIPKKRLSEEAPTAADRRRISDGVERIQWRAVLKPGNTGIAGFKDQDRTVEELSVLELELRSDRQSDRIIELVHRAIPYHVVVITQHEHHVSVSLADKRWSLAESSKMVLEEDVLRADVRVDGSNEHTGELIDHMALTQQPRASLHAVYRGWMDTLIAYLAAAYTDRFSLSGSPEHAEHRRHALKRVEMLDNEITRIQRSAGKEQQVAKRAELNLRLQELRSERASELAVL